MFYTRSRRTYRPLCLIGYLVLSLQCSFAQRQLFSAHDIWAWRTASDVRISPDGARILYVQTQPDEASNARYSNLRMATADGREDKAVTSGVWRDVSPRWNPTADRIAYLSDRGGRTQIWIRDPASGKEGPLSEVKELPLAISWAPRSEAIAFTALVPPESPPAWIPPALVGLWRPRALRAAHLFVASVTGGPARELAGNGLNWIGEPQWAADGKNIVCAAEPPQDPQHPLLGGEIFAVRPTDGVARQLTEHDGPDEAPVVSPDGSRIAWVAREPVTQTYSLSRLYVMNADGTRDKLLTGSMERDAHSPQWSTDSRTVYFLSEDSGASQIYAARNDGTVHPVTKGPSRILDFSLADNGRVAAVRSSATEATDVVTFLIDLPAGIHTVGSPDGHLLAERYIAPAEEIHFQSAGNEIQGWLVKPPNLDNSRKYPLIALLSNGPGTMYGYDVDLRAQVYAAAGYVVLLVNPRAPWAMASNSETF